MCSVAGHSINTGHQIDFNNISVLYRASGCMDCLIMEAIEVKLNYKNFNRYGSFTMSWAWYPVTNLFRQSSHLTPPKSPHWLVVNYEHGAQTGINRTEMVFKTFFSLLNHLTQMTA
jgi:hypothetical protein